VLVAGCSVLGLSQEEPTDVSIVTSAAPVADPSGPSGAPITVPTLGTGATTDADTPTPWEDLTSSSQAPTTSEPPLTAPTTTRTTLTFQTFASATKPTIAAPSLSATPPPKCYQQRTCSALDSAATSGGTVLVVNPPGGDSSVAILTVSGKAKDALSLARLGSPSVSCSGSYCLVQGTNSGVHFGALARVSGGRLKAVPGSPVSDGTLRLVTSGSSVLVAGTHMFTGYGLPVTDAPVAARTWVLGSGGLSSTGCSSPRLYTNPPAVYSAQRGSCSGTPQIAGYGSASAHPIRSLGGFSTPSGNIACALVSGKLACTVKQHDYKIATCTKPEKEVPEGLRGLRVLLGSSGGVFHDGCLGYTLIGSPTSTLSYNRLAAGDGFVCSVQESGVSCKSPSGHGFRLSRSTFKTY
jgi:hypothetical protein